MFKRLFKKQLIYTLKLKGKLSWETKFMYVTVAEKSLKIPVICVIL
jgi:hypothetical protein